MLSRFSFTLNIFLKHHKCFSFAGMRARLKYRTWKTAAGLRVLQIIEMNKTSCKNNLLEWQNLRQRFLFQVPFHLLLIDLPALFEIPRTKSLFSLFEFLSIKISPSHSLSFSFSLHLPRFQLCVHRPVRKSNCLWARSATRAETRIHRGTVNVFTGRDCLRWQANFFDYSRCIGFSRRIHDLIARMQGMVAQHATAENFIARSRVIMPLIMNASSLNEICLRWTLFQLMCFVVRCD